MRKILNSRIFRIMVCLVLICCFLVNSSPIKAKAVLAELTLAQWGILALATLLVAGISYSISSQHELEAIGSTYRTEVFRSGNNVGLTEDEIIVAFHPAFTEAASKIPYTSGGSGPNGWLALAVIAFLGLFMKSEPEPITVKQPSFGSVSEGDIISHGYFHYEIKSASAPVYYFIYCTAISHETVVCSSKQFTWGYNGGNSLDQPISITRNGINFYYQESVVSSTGGTSPECCFYDSRLTLEEIKLKCASLVADGLPTYDLFPSVVDDGLKEEFINTPEINGLDIPDIDLSSISSQQDIIDTANKIINGELSYEDLLNQFTGGETITINPTVVPEDPSTGDPGTGEPGTGTDPGTDSGSSSWTPPSDYTQFQLVDLKNFFPFCIPFDLFEFFKLLHAEPVAPVLHWEIQDLAGQTYSLSVDLSEWDSVALLFRRLQLFLFITGLAAASRKFIKW